MPPWSEAKGTPRQLPPVLTHYLAFRKTHSDARDSTIDKEVGEIAAWLRFLRSRRRRWQSASLADVDAYLIKLRRRYAVGTVAISIELPAHVFSLPPQYRAAEA